MGTEIWTIFHRTGSFTAGYAPRWKRFACWGAMAETVKGADGNGNGRNRLTLRIRNHFARLLDADGNPVSPGEAEISPGDLVTAGEAAVPDGNACWRITGTAAETGIGLVNGIVITAE